MTEKFRVAGTLLCDKFQSVFVRSSAGHATDRQCVAAVDCVFQGPILPHHRCCTSFLKEISRGFLEWNADTPQLVQWTHADWLAHPTGAVARLSTAGSFKGQIQCRCVDAGCQIKIICRRLGVRRLERSEYGFILTLSANC